MADTAQTPYHELARRALEHYEYLSNEATSWNSNIPVAIRYYYCSRIALVILTHEDWRSQLQEEDIKFLVENGEGDIMARVRKFILPADYGDKRQAIAFQPGNKFTFKDSDEVCTFFSLGPDPTADGRKHGFLRVYYKDSEDEECSRQIPNLSFLNHI